MNVLISMHIPCELDMKILKRDVVRRDDLLACTLSLCATFVVVVVVGGSLCAACLPSRLDDLFTVGGGGAG